MSMFTSLRMAYLTEWASFLDKTVLKIAQIKIKKILASVLEKKKENKDTESV